MTYHPARRNDGAPVPCRRARWMRWIVAASLLAFAACGRAPDTEALARERATTATLAAAGAYAGQGAYTAAELAYRKALETAPEDPIPALGLADLYLAWSRPESGLDALAEAIDRSAPPDETAPRRLALLSAAGRWDETRSAAEEILAGNPASLDALAALTEAHLQSRACAEAAASARHHLDAYQASVTPAPPAPLPAPVAESARVWVVLDPNSDETDRAAAQALESIDPDLMAAFRSRQPERDTVLGLRLIRAGRWGLAACVLARAVETDGLTSASAADAGQTHAWLGEALVRLGHSRDGEKHLRLAVDLAPESALAWLLLGQHYLTQGSLENARIALLNAQRLDPMNPAPCLMVAHLKAAMGQYNEVKTWIDAARMRAPGDPDIAKAAARFYMSRGLGGGEGLEAAEAAVRLAPEDAEAHMLMGWALLREARLIAARQALAKAVALDPDLAEAHYWQAAAFERAGAGADAAAARIRAADLGYRLQTAP
jgi:tetratricopeptide (TPR) repeat protein